MTGFELRTSGMESNPRPTVPQPLTKEVAMNTVSTTAGISKAHCFGFFG